MKSLKAMNRLIVQAMIFAFAIVGLMLVFPPTSDAGNRLVARSCDSGVAAFSAPVTYAYTAPACNNAPLQQRELGVDQCPQAAAAIAYQEVQRYTYVPQVSRITQVQRIHTPRAQKVLLVQDNHHQHHAQAIRQSQRQQVHHHHNVAEFRLAQNNGARRTVTKTVTRSSRR